MGNCCSSKKKKKNRNNKEPEPKPNPNPKEPEALGILSYEIENAKNYANCKNAYPLEATHASTLFTINYKKLIDPQGKRLIEKSIVGDIKKNVQKFVPEKNCLLEINKIANSDSCLVRLLGILPSDQNLNFYFETYEYNLYNIIVDNPNNVILNKIKEQIFDICETISRDLSILANQRIHHLNINLKNILVADDFKLKIINFIIPESYNFYTKIKTSNEGLYIYENQQFMAPEINKAGINDHYVDYDPQKVDMYALGMCILNMYGKIEQNFNIESLINNNSEIEYPVKQLLLLMLTRNPTERPVFSELSTILQSRNSTLYRNIWGKLPDHIPNQNFESVNFRLTIYIKKSLQGLIKISKYSFKNNNCSKILDPYIKNLELMSKKSDDSNIFLKIYDIIIEPKSVIIISEHYDNDLNKFLSLKKRFNDEQIEEIILHLLNSFEFLCSIKIFHFNINPYSFLIKPNKKIKITDFFLEDFKCMDQNDNIEVKSLYEAPEIEFLDFQQKKDLKNKEKSDVFSLGLILCQLITNKDIKSIRENIENIQEFMADRPEWMRDLILNMVAKDLHKRYDMTSCSKLHKPNT